MIREVEAANVAAAARATANSAPSPTVAKPTTTTTALVSSSSSKMTIAEASRAAAARAAAAAKRPAESDAADDLAAKKLKPACLGSGMPAELSGDEEAEAVWGALSEGMAAKEASHNTVRGWKIHINLRKASQSDVDKPTPFFRITL